MSKASEQVYGAPTPWAESVYSQAGAYGAQATEAAAVQYAAIQSLVSELVVGKEPDFTESVMNRFSSAYYTGYPAVASSASSYANEAYQSASSVVSSVFTPPAALEDILGSASDQINAAVDAVSIQLYGTEKNGYEKATEAAGSAYSSASSKASEAIYGTQPGYAEAAQNSLADVASSAQNALSVAIYGTPTGAVEGATAAAASVYSSVSAAVSSAAEENLAAAGDRAAAVSSAVGDGYAAAASRVSEAVYGPQQGALESATSRLQEVVESARARLRDYAVAAGDGANERLEQAKSAVDEMASSLSEKTAQATAKAKDEL